MKIDIVPVPQFNSSPIEVGYVGVPAQSEVVTVTLENVFAKFLQLEVGDGAASEDTIRNYLSQTLRGRHKQS